MRHAILSRNPEELSETLTDVGDRKRALHERLKAFGDSMIDDAGRQADAPLPALMDTFWRHGEAHGQLIQDGRKEEAFACLVEHRSRTQRVAPATGERENPAGRTPVPSH